MERKSLPREDLCRSVPFTITRTGENNGDGLTFEGYAAVFNSPTRIRSPYEGEFDEQIAPGAFRKSLRESTPKFQFDHGHHPMFGPLPLGVISNIDEDDRGLLTQARVDPGWFWEPVRNALISQAIDGMSFRFSVVREEWRDRDGKLVKPEELDDILFYGGQPERGPLMRTLKEIKVAEVGPVVWPAYQDTTAGLRSAVIDLGRLHEPEQRRLLAEAVLRADAAEKAPDEGDSSDDEPQDTTDSSVAVEHSDEDTDSPQPTLDESAGEHQSGTETKSESECETPRLTDEVDAMRASDADRLFLDAINEVRQARDATPPMKGL